METRFRSHDDLLDNVIKSLLQRYPQIPTDAIDDVTAGAANQAGDRSQRGAHVAAVGRSAGPGPGMTVKLRDVDYAIA